jgi:lipoate-protein ligase A
MPSPERAWRLVDSGLVQPAESAAIDEAILEAHVAGEVPDTLHFYVRAVPTVSLGYFQKAQEVLDMDAVVDRGVAVVRRKSGGSAIYTDPGQLMYGVVVDEHELPRGGGRSLEPICSAIARAVSSFGLDARFRPTNDVEVGGRKVSGSAQLRRKGSVLQHGTVIISTDLDTMDSVLRMDRTRGQGVARASERVTTLSALLGFAPEVDQVKSRLASEVGAVFSSGLFPSGLTPGERERVRELVDECYGRPEWSMRF